MKGGRIPENPEEICANEEHANLHTDSNSSSGLNNTPMTVKVHLYLHLQHLSETLIKSNYRSVLNIIMYFFIYKKYD